MNPRGRAGRNRTHEKTSSNPKKKAKIKNGAKRSCDPAAKPQLKICCRKATPQLLTFHSYFFTGAGLPSVICALSINYLQINKVILYHIPPQDTLTAKVSYDIISSR